MIYIVIRDISNSVLRINSQGAAWRSMYIAFDS